MRVATVSIRAASAIALAGCGGTPGERAAVGGVAGALILGVPGAVAGGTVGAATAR
jgi:osmotically inducible lipoprotein OsmB